MSGRQRMSRPGRSWLLALLCLIASYAYLTREQMPEMAMAGMVMPMSGSGHDQAPDPQDHSLHCPFCFTVAFALQAEALPLPAPAEKLLPAPPMLRASAGRTVALHLQARAPPLHLPLM